MKQILRVALMVLLAAAAGVGSAWGGWREYTDGNGVTWEYNEIETGATCRIKPKDQSSIKGGVEIPGTVGVNGVSIKVVSIAEEAFRNCSGLTGVTIPSSVTAIGERAFVWCYWLKSFEVESGNENYCAAGGVLFTKDKATLICYPGGKAEESYTIPSSVTAIGEYAFAGCSELTEVTMPSSVTKIGESAFVGCDGLKSVTIPGSVTEIAKEAFIGCSGLTEVTIPSSVTEIAEETFRNCSGLTAVTIPSSVKAIGKSAFSDCSGLKSVTIPGSVKVIGNWAFDDCSGLKSVTIPGSVTKIGGGAFSGCSGLKAFEVESGNENYCAENGVLFTKDKATLICYPGGKPEESYVIPNSVTKIGSGAFSGCSGLKSVTIPSSVTEIGESAFSGCSGLTSVTIPSSVTAIGECAFTNCSGLTAVTIPNSVTAIGERAFTNCRGLTAVTIPNSVTAIGWFTFAQCSGLKSVTIPSSVTAIGECAFLDCDGLTAVTILDGVKGIRERAFASCSGLKSVTIPSSVTEIGERAFANCSGLKSVTIPSSVTKIETQAFKECRGLNAVYWLADANCSVGDDAFEEIASPATLYVRHKEKEKIEGNGQTWWKKFDKIVEGYVVIFKDGEGNKLGEQLVRSNGTATEPTAPAKEGFTFVEWQLEGAKYDFSKPVTKDITLVAVWKQNDDPKTAVESVQLAAVRAVRNPVGEALELEGMERAARVEVYSVAGARVHAEALRGTPRVVIDAQGWASGVYVVRVVASDGERTLRVVK